MKKWGVINAFLSRNVGLVFLSLFTGLCYNFFTVFVPICLGRFYEFNFGFSSFRLRLLQDFKWINTPDFNQFLWFFAGVIIFRFIFEYANRYAIAILGERFSRDLRENLFVQQLQVKLPVYEEYGTGKYLLRFSGDLKSIQNYLTQGVFRFSQDLILIGILLLVLAYYSVPIFGIIALFIGVAFLLLYLLNRKLYTFSLERRDRRSGMLSYVSKTLQSIISVKAFNKEVPASKRYSGRSRKLYKVGKKYQAVVSLIHSMIPFITYLMIGGVMYYLYQLKSADMAFDEATLLVIILLIISFLPIFRRMLRVNIAWKLGHISFSKLQNIYELPSETRNQSDETSPESFSIRAENLGVNTTGNHFSFGNFSVNQGEVAMITYGNNREKGEALLKTLVKLYTPSDGDLFIGDVSYSRLKEKEIRKQIAVVSDLFPLEGKSVFEAISYSRKVEKRKRAQRVLSKINDILGNEDSMELDDKIGDLGIKLNDRQKKAAMWARAVLTRKPILILDQAFEPFEKEKQQAWQEFLSKQGKHQTLIYILPSSIDLTGQDQKTISL